MINLSERVSGIALPENTWRCRVCKGLGLCYLACLVAPLVLLIGVLAIALIAFFG